MSTISMSAPAACCPAPQTAEKTSGPPKPSLLERIAQAVKSTDTFQRTTAKRAVHPRHAMPMASSDLKDLEEGSRQFRQRILSSKDEREHHDTIAKQQFPKIHVVACSDSRLSPPEIFQMKPGFMFEMQMLGGLLPPVPKAPPKPGEKTIPEWADVAFAVMELKVEHLILLGHLRCGAVAGLMAPEAIAHNPWVSAHLAADTEVRDRVLRKFGHMNSADQGQLAVGESVLVNMERAHSFGPVREAVASGQLKVHGMVYEIGNHGAISVWDEATQEFISWNAQDSLLPNRARALQQAKGV